MRMKMHKRILLATLFTIAISSTAHATLVYSNVFDDAANLVGLTDKSRDDSGYQISGHAQRFAPESGIGYLAFIGNSNHIRTSNYGAFYITLNDLFTAGRRYEIAFSWAGHGQISANEIDPLMFVGLTIDNMFSTSVTEEIVSTNQVIGQ